MNNANKLTLEQEFKLTIYKQKIKQLNRYYLKIHLIKLLKTMMLKDNIVKYFIKNEII